MSLAAFSWSSERSSFLGIASLRAILLDFGMASPCFFFKIGFRAFVLLPQRGVEDETTNPRAIKEDADRKGRWKLGGKKKIKVDYPH